MYEGAGNGSEKDVGLLWTVSSDVEKRETFSTAGCLFGIDIFADAELRDNRLKCRHEEVEGRNKFTEVERRLRRSANVSHLGTYYLYRT